MNREPSCESFITKYFPLSDASCAIPNLSTWSEDIIISVSSGAAPNVSDLEIDGDSAWHIPDATPNMEWIEVHSS